MPQEPVKYIGDKLVVGAVDYSFVPGCVPPIPGSSILNGPVWIGAGGPPVPLANCMIGPGLQPVSLQVTGVANFLATNNQIGIFNRSGFANIFGATNKLGVDVKAAFSATTAYSAKAAAQTTQGPDYSQAFKQTPLFKAAVWTGNMATTTGMNPDFIAALAPLKPVGAPNFDIEHPIKKGWRLRYVCTEGPTADVYIKGTLKGENIIKLPDYWGGLVHSDTIHVILTSIGKHQKLFYDIIGMEIKVSSDSDIPIHCYYKVFAERKDATKNIVEYEGLTYKDYPGDNNEYRFWFTPVVFP